MKGKNKVWPIAGDMAARTLPECTGGHAETPELTEGDGQGATDAAVRKRQSCPFLGTVPFDL